MLTVTVAGYTRHPTFRLSFQGKMRGLGGVVAELMVKWKKVPIAIGNLMMEKKN